jgi:hopanoid-associated phosphorylase
LTRRIGIITGLAAEARCLDRVARHSPLPICVLHAAGDPAAAAQSLAGQGVASLMSFGIAGGLDPALSPGRVIVATAVIDGQGGKIDCHDAWRDELIAALASLSPLAAPLAGRDGAIATVAGKALLHARHGAAAVDMESHAVARVAARAGLPFAAVRAIADPADRALPGAALAGFGDHGDVRLGPVIGELLRHPGQLPALLGVARDSRKAMAALRRCAGLLFGGG